MKMRTKKLAALGMSAMMMSSMAIGVQAADTQGVNAREDGDVKVEGSADIAIDGYIKDTKDNADKSSYDENQNNPQNTASETTSWGDDETADTTQLIITAPTKLTFMAQGKGTDAELVGKTSLNTNVEGTIINQSCYIDSDLHVIPKTVDVKGKTTVGAEKQFELTETSGKNYVDGVYLYLGDTGVAYKDTVGTEKSLGTLPKGTLAETKDGAEAVNGSKTAISFGGATKGSNAVKTGFADDYETNSTIHTAYTLNLKYTVNANK